MKSSALQDEGCDGLPSRSRRAAAGEGDDDILSWPLLGMTQQCCIRRHPSCSLSLEVTGGGD
jgi:hypothetical protein